MKAHALFLPELPFFIFIPLDTGLGSKLAAPANFRKQGSELLLQITFCAMKAGFYGRHGNIHDFGNLLIRTAFKLIENEHSLLLLGQRGDRLTDELSRLVHSPGGCGVIPVGRYEDRPAPDFILDPSAQLSPLSEFSIIAIEVPAAVDGDSIYPGGDAAIVPECSGRFVYLKKNVLRDVLGILRVAQQAVAQAEDSVLIAIDEGLESSEVFGRNPPQQFSFIHRFRDLDLGAPLDRVQKATLIFVRHRGYAKLAPAG